MGDVGQVDLVDHRVVGAVDDDPTSIISLPLGTADIRADIVALNGGIGAPEPDAPVALEPVDHHSHSSSSPPEV